MSKQQFSTEAQAIWAQILGSKGFLSSNRIQSLVAILRRELNLEPAMVRFGTNFEAFDNTKFLAWRTRDFPDDYCTVYYHPTDCEAATDSKAHNWTQWANRLLGYGRKTHDRAPRMRPPQAVIDIMEAKGQLGKKIKSTRFLTLEVVIWYLAVQTRTWGKQNQHRILDVKDYIRKNDVNVIAFVPGYIEPIDVDGLFNDDDGDIPAPKVPKTRVPKAGRGLVSYNPTTAPTRQPKNAPVAGAAVDTAPSTVDLMAVDTSIMTDDELDAHIQALQDALQERRARARKVKYREAAAQAVLIHGADDTEVWPDRPQYATVVVRYPDGTEVTYYHQQLMAKAKGDSEGSVDDILGSLVD